MNLLGVQMLSNNYNNNIENRPHTTKLNITTVLNAKNVFVVYKHKMRIVTDYYCTYMGTHEQFPIHRAYILSVFKPTIHSCYDVSIIKVEKVAHSDQRFIFPGYN